MVHHRSLSLAAALVGLALSTSPEARAQQDLDTQVRALLRDGEDALAQERLEDAEEAYEKAYALKPGFDVAANLADVERRLGKLTEAAEHYAIAIRSFPSSFDNRIKRELQTALAEVQTEVATVELEVVAPGATVTVDRRNVGVSPLQTPLYLRPGEHVLGARVGEASASETLTLRAGTTTGLVLDPKPTSPEPPSDDGGEASPDEGATNLSGPVLVAAGGGLVLVGLVAGAALTVAANGKASDAAAAPIGSTERRDLQEAQQPLANGALWSFVGAGVGALAAGVGAYLWLTADGPTQEGGVSLSPWTFRNAYGAQLVGRW